MTHPAWHFAPLILLMIAGLTWLYDRWRGLASAANAALSGVSVVAIQNPRGGSVPRRKTVTGIVYPQTGRLIQVFVKAGPAHDVWWYRQGERAVVDGFQWSRACTFGDEKSPTRSMYEVCAIVPVMPIRENRLRSLPADAVSSVIVTVDLDRSLPDDWHPKPA